MITFTFKDVGAEFNEIQNAMGNLYLRPEVRSTYSDPRGSSVSVVILQAHILIIHFWKIR